MPSYLSFVKLGALPEPETPEQRRALDVLDDASDHTVDTYANALADASQEFPNVEIEAAGADGDWGTHVLFRARAGHCDTIWFEEGARRSAKDRDRLDALLAPKPFAGRDYLETMKLGFPRAMHEEIVAAKERGARSDAIIAQLWDRIRPKLKSITGEQIEAAVRAHSANGQVAAHYFVGDRLRKQLKKAADTHGVKVSALLTYAWTL